MPGEPPRGLDVTLRRVIRDCFPPAAALPTVCVHLGEDVFWEHLKRALEERGDHVVLVQAPLRNALPPDFIPEPLDSGAFYLRSLGRFRCSLIVLQMPPPCDGWTWQPCTYEAFARYRSTGHPTILLEWPTAEVLGSRRTLLEVVCLRALTPDYVLLRARNRELAEKLDRSPTITVTCPRGTSLTLARGSHPIVREDCAICDDQRLFQLPGGEVFFAPEESTTTGDIVTVLAGVERRVHIRAGVAHFGEIPGYPREAPVAEFGLGTNPNAAPVGLLSLGEKALGTCHLGFGDSRDFGGQVRADFHFDVLIKDPTIVLGGRL